MNKITPLSSGLPSAFNVFSKQLSVDGVIIYAVAQVTDAQLNYAASVMKQLLSRDTGEILSNMVKNGAGLTMFADADQRDSAVGEAVFESAQNRMLQDLQADEVFPPGTSTIRDATVEEVTHLIHNSGITAAKPEAQKALDLATQNAIKEKLYHPELIGDDLPAGDYDDEYLAAGVEAYYGTKDPALGTSVFGPANRDELKLADIDLFNVIESIFPSFLPAAQGSHYIDGTQGRDALTSSSTDETFYGFYGTDTVKFTSASSGYNISKTKDGINISGPDGNDNLVGIERLQFSDQVLAFEAQGNAGQVYRLYKTALNRAPDKEGLGYWINDADTGSTLSAIATSFINSNEFKTLYGDKISDAEYLTALYSNVLNRAPDSAGMEYWANSLSSGQESRTDVLIGFSESAENKTSVEIEISNGISYDFWIG